MLDNELTIMNLDFIKSFEREITHRLRDVNNQWK